MEFILLFFTIVGGLSIPFAVLAYVRNERDKAERKRNSVVFTEPLTPIWKAAAKDWVMENDDRPFEQFLQDTIELIRRGPQR